MSLRQYSMNFAGMPSYNIFPARQVLVIERDDHGLAGYGTPTSIPQSGLTRMLLQVRQRQFDAARKSSS